MSSNSNPVVNSCCALVYTSPCLIVKSELISIKSFPQRRLRSQNSAGNTVCWLLVLWSSGSAAKCEEQSFAAQSPPKFPSVHLWGKKNNNRTNRESIIHYIYILKIVCMTSHRAWVLWAHAHQPDASRCTGFETLHSPSLSIEHPVIDLGPHTRKGIFPTVVKSFQRQGIRTTNGIFGIP
jgi:hypothetical protein